MAIAFIGSILPLLTGIGIVYATDSNLGIKGALAVGELKNDTSVPSILTIIIHNSHSSSFNICASCKEPLLHLQVPELQQVLSVVVKYTIHLLDD